MRLTLLAGLVALIVLVSPAQAALVTITFGSGGSTGFTGSGIQTTGAVALGGGLTLTVQAGRPIPVTNTGYLCSIGVTGWGIDSASDCAAGGDEPQMDGDGSQERMTFTFSTSVRLVNLVLGNWDADDGGTVANGGTAITGFNNVAAFAGSTLTMPGATNGTSFYIQVVNDDTLDNYTVRSLTFESDLLTPEPSTYLMMGGGLAVLALLRRRKKSA